MSYKSSHNITLILPNEITLEVFEELVNGALRDSNYSYETHNWISQGLYNGPYKENVVTRVHKASDYELKPLELKPLVGRDFTFEFERKVPEVKMTQLVYMVDYAIDYEGAWSGPFSGRGLAEEVLKELKEWCEEKGKIWNGGKIIEKEIE